MKTTLYAAAVAAALGAVAPVALYAGPIDRACMTSSREAKSWGLCRCIQRVANDTLSRTDQRKAAEFFKDPQKAQDIRTSESRTHERFWERYTAFGATAAAICS